MATDLGNLSLGLQIPGLAMLDALETRLAAMDRATYVARLGVDTGAITQAEARVSSLGAAHQALNTTSTLGLDYSQVAAGRSAVQGLDGDVGALASSLSKLAAPAALAGIGLGVTKLASDFQTMTTNIRNNTTETDADFAKMSDTIKSLSAESGASLDALGTGFMHAFNLTGSATQATTDLGVAMKSAVSTGSDVNATTDALAKTMHQFGIANSEAAATMDTLHTASALGNTTLEQFIGASAKAMVTAASLGVSLQDVSSAYVGLTRSGFDAGEANTQIAALLTHLIKPSAEAKAAIADLAKTTGVDLTADFSLAGIQSKGLVGVLGDIRAATNGQEDAVLKLIPAQRGGIGALALTTSAYKDVIDAGTQLAAVQSGQLTPTADAYARTQETLGFKVGVLGQQFKQLGIDMGDATIGPVSAVVGALGHIPEGVDKAAVGLGVAALGFKALGAASDLLVAGTAKLGTAIAGDAAAMIEETAAVDANTASLVANAGARDAAAAMTGVAGYGARVAASQTGTEAAGLAGYEARTAAQAGTGAAERIGGGVTSVGAGIGAAAIPVAIPVALGYVIGSQVVDPIFKGIEETKQRVEATKEEMTVQTTIRYAESADTRAQGRADLQKIVADGQAMVTEVSALGGGLQDDPATKAALARYRSIISEAQQALSDTSPEHYAAKATDEFAAHLTDLTDAVNTNRLSLAEATKFADDYRQQAIATGEGVDQATAAEKAWALALANSADAAREKLYVDLQTQQAERDRAKQLLDEGAPASVVEVAVFGKGLGVDPATLLEQQAELASWEKTYAAETAAKKTNDAAQLASAKQRIADEATAAKAAASEQAATQTAAAQAVEQAWNAAASAISGLDKRLDGAAAIGTLAGINDQLHATQDALSAVGQDSPHLDALTGLSDIFKGITDQTDKASEALNAYNLTLSNTNKAIQEIGTLKGEYLAALDAAQRRVANGTADDSDRQIIAMRQSALGTLDSQTSALQQAGNRDILGQIANLPNYSALDANARATLAANGGAQHLLLTITTNADAAQQEIKDKLLQSKQMQLDIKTNAKDVQDQIDNIAKARTADLTIVTHFVDDRGRPTVDPTLDPARGYGEPQGGAGYVPPAGGGAGSTATPNGDASVIEKYGAEIQKAAAANNIPPWMLGAIIMHESSGQPGIPNAQGSGALGLTQIIPSGPGWSRNYTPEQMALLTGTSPDAANFQIDQGASILRDFLNNNDNNVPAALAQYGGGDPHYYDTLVNTYKDPVTNALNAPYSTSAAGGKGAGTGTGIAAGDAALSVGASLFGQGTASASGGTDAAILATARQHIGQQLDNFGKTVNGKCEEIVDDILAQTGKGITDFRANSTADQHATADAHIRAAMAGVPGAGHVVSAQDARPGDEVGWLGTSKYAGDPAGHIGILSGKNSYIGTSSQGVIERPLGPDAIFIRPDGVVAAGPEPGTTVAKAPTGSAAASAATSVGGATGVPANINGTTGGTPPPAIIPPDFSKAAEDLSVALAKLDPAALKDAGQQFANILPALTKMQENKISTDPANLTSTDKQNALNAATQQGLQYETDYANLVRDVENHTGNIKDDVATIAADVGGPMADGYAKAALASAQLAASQDAITKLQEQQKLADAAQQQVVAARTLADQADSRQQTIAGWAQQAVQNALADKQTVENAAFVATQRNGQDAATAADRANVLAQRQTADQLASMQKLQATADSGNSALEQNLSVAAAGPGDLGSKLKAQELLSIQKDFDSRNRQTLSDQIAAIQTVQLAQNRGYEDRKYQLAQEATAAQRKHEDAMTGYAAEGTALTRQQQAAAQSHTISQWQIQDTRTAEDAKYTEEKTANTAAQEAQTAIGKTAQASLDTANQALSVWQTTQAVVSIAAGQAAAVQSAAANNYAANPTYTRTLGTHATGGSVSGWGIVGDSPAGDMSSAEAVYGSYTVIPHDASVRAGLISGTSGGSSKPGVTINAPITVNGVSEADIKRAVAEFEATLRKGIAQMTALPGGNFGIGRGA